MDDKVEAEPRIDVNNYDHLWGKLRISEYHITQRQKSYLRTKVGKKSARIKQEAVLYNT